MKILWLPGWYPNKLAPFDGDFVQRHARAASLLHFVEVIFLKKDEQGEITNDVKEYVTTESNLTERIIYYHPVSTGIKFIDKYLSHRHYKKVYKNAVRKYIVTNGKPDFSHNYIVMKAGIMALWLKKKYNIPYIISEQWTGYLNEAKPNISGYNFIQKKWWQEIFSKASEVTVVSKVLGETIKEKFCKNYTVIQNVVDTNIFFPVEKQPALITKFIHVSLLNYQKNSGDIIEAFYLVKNKGYNFQLTIYGPDNNQIKQLVKNKNLETQIIFKKEASQNILAIDMQQSDALILYSLYETFGCVVIEANACGIPAILSDLPVFREYIIENKTGIFSKLNSPESLADSIINFILQKKSFSQTEISNYTKIKFSYELIAKQFDELYKSIIK